MKNKLVAACLVMLALAPQVAKPWKLTWNLSDSDTNGTLQNYSFYYETDTNQGGLTLFASAPPGATSLVFTPTNMPNPCYLVGQVLATNGNVSAYSFPYLFDTNGFPNPPGFLHVRP